VENGQDKAPGAELCRYNSSTDIISVIKLREMMMENMARLGEIIYAFQTLSGNSTRRDYSRGFRRRKYDNIKTHFGETEYKVE
jgi:hypothetical protein